MSLYRKRRNDFIPTNEVISSVSFSIFTPEEIKQLAVKKIITPLTFDTLGHPIPGGLYDRLLGPMNDKSDSCGTCQKLISKCPGHMGYIELPLPVINPMFHHLIGNILKISCLRCFTIQLPVQIKTCLAIQVKLLNGGMIAEALELDDLINAVAIKIESKEDIPNEIQKTIKHLDQLARSVKDKPDGDIQLTKEAEQLRKQFAVNITKYFKQGKCCISCSQFGDRLKYQKNRIILHYKSDKAGDNTVVKEYLMKYVNPDESRNYLRGIWKKEPDLLMLIAPVLANFKNREHPTDIFYFEVVPVPPPMCRPANYLKGKMSEHPKTNAYRSILQNSIILNTIIYVMKQEGEDTGELSAEAKDVYNSTKGNSAVEKLNNVWETLQSNIDGIMDKDLSRQNEFLGLKQIIEKKQGMLRMHMMGKRVNFSARSVITPDPNLKIDEIGIPETFAKQLTYPTYVNSHNIEELRKMVMNGPNIHPGAAMVEFQNGNIIRLDPKNPLQRESIAKRLLTPTEVKNQDYREQKLVHRHLCNGDILLLNRQPSLHKPSVMAHKARILRGERTFRLHYANCKAYNADFDGDEMNAHFPQSEKARSEAQCIVNVSNQYLVPKDGTPLSGLIQDHVISGVKLSMRGRFFNKMNYNHLVFQALYHRTRNIKTLPPAIIKPEMLWSGKQVLSTIIMNIIPDGKELINLTSESKIKARDWQNTPPRPWKAGGTPFEDDLEMSESRVIVRHGELLSGVLDKSHYGATPYGLIHCVYELYGGPCATEMLSSLTRLFTTYLQKEGFTLGVEDIITLASADKKRRRIIRNLRTVGPEIMKKALNISGDVTEDEIVEMLDKKLVDNPNFTALVDKEYKFNLNNFTNQMNKASMTGLLSKFPKNNLQLMVTSGAKGSTVNTMQISCCLGQIELEGKRPPRMISGKTLPSFTRSEFSPRSGGFIEQRFMTGIQPQEFFFHCMAGREGLVDTAVKTSRSGYLQRCLVKSLEGVHVKADLTVRDSDNRVIQFLYGQDGMDVGKAQFLLKKHLPFLHENVHAILDKKFIKAEAKTERSLTVKEYTKMIKDWKTENESPLSKRKLNPFTLFSKFFAESSDRELTKDQLVQLWREAGDEVRQSFVDKCKQCPDTLNSTFYPHSHFGSINERIENLIKNYEGCTGKKDKKTFENMMKQKSMTSLCDTGEAVGLLAAQSIGEPSTQMTLNTFHFAGRGEMNVTLGIPRLREILMMASKNIKTPSMEIPFLPTDNLEHESETLRKKLNRVTVSDVLQDVEVEIASDVKKFVYRYTLKFIFLRHRRYIKDYCVNPKYVIKHMRKKFFKLLLQVIAKQNKFNDMVVIGESKRANREVEDDEVQQDLPAPESDSSDEEPEDEDDAKARKKYEAVHDDQEDEDEEMEETHSENEGEEENAAMNGSKIDDTDLQFMSTYRMVEDITCDQEKYLWCQMTFTVPFKNAHFDLTSLLKEVAAKSVIWEVPNIKKSITYMKDGVMTLRTDGINIPEMFKYDKILDLNKLYCNDIHKMIEHFGVEAGMAAIEKEIKDVFQVYGITIDPRHLLLISEFMTWKGTFEPMNRAGMQNSASPFQQMSFEASLTFLKEAVIGGKLDDLSNPSSSLMAGTISSIGSGGFDLLTKFSLCS